MDISAVYVSHLATNVVDWKNFDIPGWDTFAPYIEFLTTSPEPNESLGTTMPTVVEGGGEKLKDVTKYPRGWSVIPPLDTNTTGRHSQILMGC